MISETQCCLLQVMLRIVKDGTYLGVCGRGCLSLSKIRIELWLVQDTPLTHHPLYGCLSAERDQQVANSPRSHYFPRRGARLRPSMT